MTFVVGTILLRRAWAIELFRFFESFPFLLAWLLEIVSYGGPLLAAIFLITRIGRPNLDRHSNTWSKLVQDAVNSESNFPRFKNATFVLRNVELETLELPIFINRFEQMPVSIAVFEPIRSRATITIFVIGRQIMPIIKYA